MVYCLRSVLSQFIIILMIDIFNVIMSGRVGEKNGYDSLTIFFGGGDFFNCLNFVTNRMFQISGLH